ncbi:MAG: hypothetical protein JWQ84_1742 [Mucilaginibacter sp.]|nr:hypothetical protein [Mucilaginibacter sp.]MDB5016910.1 hypothetical protein [Mucilaginibacter sp.]MDB5138725.1 hypothetical protein [Mucilaginibacter sp.]
MKAGLLTKEMIRIAKFEKQLYAFHDYTFDDYSNLQLIDVYLKFYIRDIKFSTDRQHLLDLSCEIENEIESLQSLQYCADKNMEFSDRVQSALSIIKRLKECFPKFRESKNVNVWNRFKFHFATN